MEEIDDHQWVLRPLSPDRVGIDFGDVGNVGEALAARLLERMAAELAHIHLLSHDSAVGRARWRRLPLDRGGAPTAGPLQPSRAGGRRGTWPLGGFQGLLPDPDRMQ